jgi:hypothetical protein
MLPPSSRSEIGRVDGAQLGQEAQHEMREKLRLVGSRTVVSQETFHHEEKRAFFKFTDWEVGTEKTALFEGPGRGTTSQAEVTTSPSGSSSCHSF